MKLPTYLPSLTKLSVYFCPKLESPLSRLPLLKELDVGECNEAVLSSGNDLTSLTELKISRISGLIKLHEGFVQFLQGLRVLEVSECEELEYLWEDGFGSENSLSLEIRDCDQLVSLGCNLQSLEIDRCDKLERLPNGWQSLTCLEVLRILGCPKLASFPDVGFPPMLRILRLDDCEGLKSLPDGMMLKMRNDSTDSNNSCVLEFLHIEQCPSFICFPKGQLPTTLKSLSIRACENLKSLPEEMMGMCALEHIFIDGCHSLIGLPKGGLPATLKRLTITDCRRLESLPEGIMHQHSTNAAALQALAISSLKSLPEGMMHCNSIATTSTMDMCALEYLNLHMCPSLIGFPRGRLPITLKELRISNCEKLESLPEGIMHYDSTYAAALQGLAISHCSSLTSFPRGKFPSTLELLDIRDCEHLESISEEMFHSTNNSRQYLNIER
ncbi:disease resistance protein TAO1-like isoform X2 [Vitis riparia]|nr:disease resistance protein TAO1-like isoform X2 [Vitis riparia]